MKRLALLVLVGLAAMGGVAQAQEPFLPGQVKSQAFAQSIWNPPCQHVSVVPLTAPPDANGDDTMGRAEPSTCQIWLNATALQANANFYGNTSRAKRRELEVWTCTVLVHEYGHLATFYDPVGFTWGVTDHAHSPDPQNVMYPYFNQTWPPCRALFPRAAISRRAR